MREILFRGRRLDNGEWVEGFYHMASKGAWLNPIENGHYITTFKKLENGEIILTGCYEVDPATVGQFTGLMDKHGMKIFEGDVVKAIIPKRQMWGEIVLANGPVFYEDASFRVPSGEHPNSWVRLGDFAPNVEIEVIGNAHESHELLGGA